MESKEPRFSTERLERILNRLDVTLTEEDRAGLHDLAEISSIFETIQSCLIAIQEEEATSEDGSGSAGQIGQWLVDIQIELFEHLPMHLERLRDNLGALAEKVCELDEEDRPASPSS